jgi:hypothetical protein
VYSSIHAMNSIALFTKINREDIKSSQNKKQCTPNPIPESIHMCPSRSPNALAKTKRLQYPLLLISFTLPLEFKKRQESAPHSNRPLLFSNPGYLMGSCKRSKRRRQDQRQKPSWGRSSVPESLVPWNGDRTRSSGCTARMERLPPPSTLAIELRSR